MFNGNETILVIQDRHLKTSAQVLLFNGKSVDNFIDTKMPVSLWQLVIVNNLFAREARVQHNSAKVQHAHIHSTSSVFHKVRHARCNIMEQRRSKLKVWTCARSSCTFYSSLNANWTSTNKFISVRYAWFSLLLLNY